MEMKDSIDFGAMNISKLFRKLLIPTVLGMVFSAIFVITDGIFVGKGVGSDALAAVSSSGSLTFLLVGFFQGMAMGAGVIIARYFGARQQKELQKAIHTTVAFGILCGILLTISGVVLAPKILVLMKTPADILPKSTLYFQVYAMGSLGLVLYNT